MRVIVTSTLFVFATSFAGSYATVVWGWFGWLRLRRRQWILGLIDFVLAACSGVVAVTALSAGLGLTITSTLFDWFRLVLLPLMVLPVTLHLRQLRGIQEMIQLAGETEDFDRANYASDKADYEAKGS